MAGGPCAKRRPGQAGAGDRRELEYPHHEQLVEERAETRIGSISARSAATAERWAAAPTSASRNSRPSSGTGGLIGAFQLGSTSHRLAFGFDGYSTTRLEERLRGPVDPIDIFAPRYTGAAAPSPFAVEDQSVDMIGLYAQNQIALGDALVVQLGLRYTTFDQLTIDQDDGTEEEFSDEEWTTSVGLVHRVTPDVSLYGSMSEAFAPTLSVDRDGNAFDPNYGRQFELGLKADLLDRRLSTTVAIYHLRRTGMISFVRPPEGGFYRVQSGVQRSRGFEVDLLGRLTGSVSAIASYGFTDGAVLEDDVYATGHGLGGAPRHHGSLWLRGGLRNGFYAGAGVFFPHRSGRRSPATLTPGCCGGITASRRWRATRWPTAFGCS